MESPVTSFYNSYSTVKVEKKHEAYRLYNKIVQFTLSQRQPIVENNLEVFHQIPLFFVKVNYSWVLDLFQWCSMHLLALFHFLSPSFPFSWLSFVNFVTVRCGALFSCAELIPLRKSIGLASLNYVWLYILLPRVSSKQVR